MKRKRQQDKLTCTPGLTRRDALRLGALGLTLPGMLALRAQGANQNAKRTANANRPASASRGFGKAKSCIVLFAWGGMSHIDTFDMKPDAASNVRSAFGMIKSTTPGYHVCEHLPHIAKQTHRMAIVRSVHHKAPSHRSAAYWNLTGHEPPNLGGNWEATRKDWPCIGSMVAQAHATGARVGVQDQTGAMPGTVALPYTMADGGRANGQDAGFLGLKWDPVVVRPKQGKPYQGVSPSAGSVDLSFIKNVGAGRVVSRRGLLETFDQHRPIAAAKDTADVRQYQQMALDMLVDPKVRAAFNLDKEPKRVRDAYGDHICGQSTLLARKLTEAGVPLVTVYCAAGDLNGSVGAHWDTHGDGYNRLKNQMLPPLDQASAALLNDLHERGRLDDTLVVWLTEFGRTPKLKGGGGRDHYPNCYTVAFAGGGIAGGQIYGRSDMNAAFPAADACGPADLHATIFHALGIDPNFHIRDIADRPLAATDGKPLPLFG